MTIKKILNNTFIQILGRIITALLAVISIKIITLELGVEGYGYYTTVYEFVGLFAIVGDLGLYTIAVREIAVNSSEQQKIYSNVLSMRVIFTGIVMLLVGIGGMFIPAYQNTLIPIGIWICTLVVWLNLFNSIVTSILQYHLKMGLATISLIIGKIISVVVIIISAIFINHNDIKFYMIIIAGIIGHGAMSLLSIYFASKYIKIKLAFDFVYWKMLLKKSLPYGIALILSTIYFKIDVTLLSFFRDQNEVGLYGVALRMIEVLVVLPLFFMNSILGTMTKIVQSLKIDKYNQIRLQNVFDLSLQFLLTCAIPIGVAVYFFASDFICLIANNSFIATANNYGADSVLVLLTIALILSFFSTMISFTLVAFNEQKKVLWVNASGAIFNLSTNFYFIPKYGFMGAAYTSIASELLILIIAYILLQQTYKFKFDWLTILKTFSAGLGSFGLLYYLIPYLKNFHFLIQISVAGMVATIFYLGFLWLTKVVNKEKISSIKDVFLPI